jgi:TetR/AcrR family transcriptional regulator, transcriptional repressor for nem operon
VVGEDGEDGEDVVGEGSANSGPRLTSRGAATRARIVSAAAELMYLKGVAATTLGEILISSGTSKSQFRAHFIDKDHLVRAVITFRAREILDKQTRRLEKVDSFRGLEQWREALLQRNALRRGAWGCELGSLSSELADTDDDARQQLVEAFRDWLQLLAGAFERMRDNGALAGDVDPAAMATSVMAAVQGGYLLAQLNHDSTPMKLALDMALDHVRSFQASPDA